MLRDLPRPGDPKNHRPVVISIPDSPSWSDSALHPSEIASDLQTDGAWPHAVPKEQGSGRDVIEVRQITHEQIDVVAPDAQPRRSIDLHVTAGVHRIGRGRRVVAQRI